MIRQLEQEKQTEVITEKDKKREGKGRSLAVSRMVYRLQNTDTYYLQSESAENIYYFVRYNFGVLEWCSCPDSSV